MRVAFINENTLGHASYLRPFARWFSEHPELDVEPVVIDATPLPESIRRWADTTVPLLRRWGADFHGLRWRLGASRHAAALLKDLRGHQQVDAVVVNTQSVGLGLCGVAREIPVLVCLDATFAQLGASAWFTPNRPSRLFAKWTVGRLQRLERRLFESAPFLLPWSQAAGDSLRADYGLGAGRVQPMPPSLRVEEFQRGARAGNQRPQILFLGGDFERKGGPLLLEVFRKHFAERCDLHIVTQSQVSSGDGVTVHHGVRAWSPEWRQRWEQADLFVFPSRLETFGIVLLEALAFGVPVISSRVGAAEEMLRGGQAGWLLGDSKPETLRDAIQSVLENHPEAMRRAEAGRSMVAEGYDLDRNSRRLAELLHAAARISSKVRATG